MSTCVLYIDEGGTADQYDLPLLNGQSPLFCLAGVAFKLEDWRLIDRDYLRLKNTFFKAEIGRSSKRPEHWEAKSVCAPRNSGSARTQRFISEVLDLLVRFEAKGFGVTFLKNSEKPTPPETMYTMGLQRLSERFNAYVNEHASLESGLIIADRRQYRLDLGVGNSYLSYIFGHDTGKQLTSLQEGPLFAHSTLTACLQIAHSFANLLAGNHYDYYCSNLAGALDYSHLKQYWSRLRDLEFKSKKEYDGRLIFGYKVHNFQ